MAPLEIGSVLRSVEGWLSRVRDIRFIMGSKPNHLRRHRGLIRAAQRQSSLHAFIAVGLVLTMTSPTYAGRNVFGAGGASPGNRDAVRAQAYADSQANALRIQASARERLARSTSAFQGMQGAQAAARASAAALNNVANGLVPGGLEVLSGSEARWDGADAPVAAGNNVNIKQKESQAVLHWKTFNVGRDTTVNFDQSKGGADAGKWIAFNKVFDPAAAPSQIRGRINAQGQVYIINRNGVIFGGTSQINTRGLVASSLPVNDNLVKAGLLNNKDAQFIFSGLRVPGGSDGTPAFEPPPLAPGEKYGDIVVERGARLQATAGQDGNGGRVMLVGANVVNEGTIDTPAGQTVLAAGLQVGVRAHPENDPSLRGLDVWIGQVGDYAGRVENNGLVQSSTGSIIMAGKEVLQRGVLFSTTSVNLNGRIDLLASYGAVANPNFDRFTGSTQPPFLSQFTGTVEMAPGSITSILPDANGKKLPGSRLSENSQVNIEGRGIYFGRGSILMAPSGDVSVRAGVWPFVDTDGDGTALGVGGSDQPGLSQHFTSGGQKFLFESGQVYLDEGALIDVSGSVDGFVPLAQHLLTVAMRSSELADSPLQRNSELRGVPLIVDLRQTGVDNGRSWIGTPLGDLTGYLAIIERDIAQLTARGGTVSLSAGDSIVMRHGATVDVSGGLLTHGAGFVQTSMLSLGGRATPISSAYADINYDGVYTGMGTVTSKWRGPQSYSSGIFNPAKGYNQDSYFEGAPAGAASFTAPSLALAGNLVGKSYVGPNQRETPPALGSLRLAFLGEKNAGSVIDPRFVNQSPFAPEFRLVAGRASTLALPEFELVNGAPAALPAHLRGTFTLGTAIFDEEEGGFGNLSVENADGEFVVAAGTTVRSRPGGSIKATAKNVRMDGSILAPAGSVALTAYNFSPYLYAELSATGALAAQPAPAVQPGRGLVALGNSSRIDVSGMMVDDRGFAANPTYGPVLTDGGSAHLEGYAVQLPFGSIIDTSGGVYAFGRNKFSYGDGGEISILSGRDPDLATSVGGTLQLGGTLQAYSGTKGGALSLQSNFIHLGGANRPSGGINLSPAFFQSGGFATYNLIGLGGRDGEDNNLAGVVVAGDIRPLAQTLVQQSRASASDPAFRRFGTDVFIPLVPEFAGDRQAVSLNLSAKGFDDGFTENKVEALGIVEMLAGSRITTEAGAFVSLEGNVVRVNGSINAPGGSITIVGRDSFRLSTVESQTASAAQATVEIGSSARLSAVGTAVALPDLNGLRAGKLFPGGSIAISGNIVAAEGAVFDVRGSSVVFDFSPQRLGLPPSDPKAPFKVVLGLPTRVDSDGGRITLAGSQMLYSDATLLGAAGGPSALGGSLSVSSGRFYAQGVNRSGADINMVVRQEGSAAEFRAAEGAAGLGFFAVDRFDDGGFDSLNLGYFYLRDASPPYGGNIEFRDPVSIQANQALRVAGGGIIKADAPVSLSAPYIAIGQRYQAPLNPSDPNEPFREFNASTGGTPQIFVPPTSGDGLLDVQASLIDVGHLSLQGISRAELTAQWDIRGYGSLNVVGDLVLAAGQIYPTTLSAFDLFAFDNPEGALGSVTIQGLGNRPLPLSAGGSLRIMASSIMHGGTLRAPLGTIALGWDEVDLDEASVETDGPSNIVVGRSLPTPATRLISLENGSVTSVSAVDPSSGAGILIPYGLSPNGFSWIDPRGVDVTAGGLPSRGVSIGADGVTLSSEATVDLRGGGDLLAYRWISGIGGTADLLGTANSKWSPNTGYKAGNLVQHKGGTWSARTDINPADYAIAPEPSKNMQWALLPESFAVLPGYQSGFAPLNEFNTGPYKGPLSGDTGYSTSGLRMNEQVFLAGLPGLPAGSYTLLPRRYALLPGAFLVQPEGNKFISSGSVVATSSLNSGSLPFEASTLLSDGIIRAQGFSFNGLNTSPSGALLEYMAVLTPAQIAARAQYDKYTANGFLEAAAKRLDLAKVQLLPKDSARAAFHGNTGLVLEGSVLARSVAANGNRASIDISSFGNIRLVGGDGTADESTSLRTDTLGGWGAGSLLIGGLRRETTDGTAVDVRSPSVILDNPGNEFVAPEIILAAADQVVTEAGSALAADDKGVAFTADPLLLAGEGALLRVSADKNATSLRSGVGSEEGGSILSVGAGSVLTGSSVTMDSSSALSLDFTSAITTRSLALSSGQISVLMGPYEGDLDGSVVENHLVLDDEILSQLGALEVLRLASYRTIDLYGSGALGSSELGRLELLSGGLRGFGSGDNNASVSANTLVLANPNSVSGLPVYAEDLGSLTIEAGSVILGAGAFSASGYGQFFLNSAGGLLMDHDGSLHVAGSLAIAAPQIVTGQGVRYDITSERNLDLVASEGEEAVPAGLGGRLSLTGSSVNVDTAIDLPAGVLSITATEGDVVVGGHLSVAGQAREFFDVTRYANAGSIELVSRSGAVVLQEGSFVSVSADEGGGDAGTLDIKSPGGTFSLGGAIVGMAQDGNISGTLALDAGSIENFDELSSLVDAGGFREERALRVRDGDVLIGGATRVRNFSLSADGGDINVRGRIDASGQTGGSIRLVTSGNLTLEAMAVLDVSGRKFSNAGKGGSVVLEAGSAIDGRADEAPRLSLEPGSLVDLSVDAFRPGPHNASGSSAFYGQVEGTLHLRAPRTGNDIGGMGPIASTINRGSSVLVEGFRVYQPEGGIMNIALRDSIHADNTQFINDSEATLRSRLLTGPNTTLDKILVLAPGVEILNLDGDLILGQANVSGSENIEALSDADWDLSSWRYGLRGAPGVLTLRAAGDLVFNNALSDGFTPVAASADSGWSRLWLAPLQSISSSLPVNTQSWSYRLVAGADAGSADYRKIQSIASLDLLDSSKGSILVGEYMNAAVPSDDRATRPGAGVNGLTANTVGISSSDRTPQERGTRYEVIRTGTGSIEVAAGRDIQLRNPFATIYTAGVGLADRTAVFASGDFVLPVTTFSTHPAQGGTLGAAQQNYQAYYAMAGGDLRLAAGRDIGRFARLGDGTIVADSSMQLPTHWLYRRGLVDSSTGLFSPLELTDNRRTKDHSASTTWWVDYSNFFQGFGALGGGDIRMVASRDLVNADAAIPTSARMAGQDAASGASAATRQNLAPDAANLLEHGGGDLVVRAGRNLDGGNYYAERGEATLRALDEITTNEARSLTPWRLTSSQSLLDPSTWQAVTLYGGRTQFDVAARGDVLLGPTTAAFLLPQGLNNKFWYKTQFQTVDPSSGMAAASIGGAVTHRLGVTLPGDTLALPVLEAVYRQGAAISPGSAAYYRPWLRSAETATGNFRTIASVALPTLRSTAFGGDVTVVGQLNLFPSPQGELELLAAGAIPGLAVSGVTSISALDVTAWTSTRLNLSDADPARLPTVVSPVGNLIISTSTSSDTWSSGSALFLESGSYKGVYGTTDVKSALHAATPVHAGNPNPVRLYAAGGDLANMTLFAPKKIRAIASRDITDIAFYLQHTTSSDISLISAGRDLIPFNENAPLRVLGGNLTSGNLIVDPEYDTVVKSTDGIPVRTKALAGDIQIGGQGIMQVLAGRDIDFGSGFNFVDGTGVGLTSIGRLRNPSLPFEGAHYVVMAGVGGASSGPALGLTGSSLAFANLPATGFLGDTAEHKAVAAVRGLFDRLKQVGKEAAQTGSYDAGYAAVEAIFGKNPASGTISTRARDMRTTSGGSIIAAAPGGGVTMASDIFGNPLTPPGIVTEYGGEVSMLTGGNIDIGRARIFTLRGGDLTIWSSRGDIAAGTAAKTVVTAPPTRVLIDAISAEIETDLGGLATGGGIGVLASVAGVDPGAVTLLAPRGTVDAGDAGIRATGNITIAAAQVRNADNIASGGASTGVPVAAVAAAPNVAGLSAASSSTAATTSAASDVAQQGRPETASAQEPPSTVSVEVLGYGGGEEREDEREARVTGEAGDAVL
jgi:filamentous hemagglutinin family protein